jgi:hypothetical protein
MIAASAEIRNVGAETIHFGIIILKKVLHQIKSYVNQGKQITVAFNNTPQIFAPERWATPR